MKDMVKLSINNILKLKEFKNSIILSGNENLNKKINKINIILDTEIEFWIRPEEFLLSTFSFFKGMSDKEQIEFIKKLIDKGIACLGIKVSSDLEKLSDEAIEFAKINKFVIFTIDYNQSFTNMISSIYEGIFDRQMDVINRISTIHDQAMDILIEGGNIYDIISTFENATGNQVFIIDNYYERFYYNSESMGNENYLKSIKVFNNNHRKDLVSKGKLKIVSINNKSHHRYIYPIYVKNSAYGYIAAFMKDSEYLNMNMQLIESISTVASLYFYNRLSLEEVDIGYRSEFLENLISDDKKRHIKAFDKSMFFNMNKEDEFQIVQFIIDEEYSDNQSILKYLHKIKLFMNYFEQPNVLAIINNRINMLYKYDDEFYIKLIQRIEKNSLIKQNDKIIFGRKVKGLENISKSYRDCVKILKNPGIIALNKITNYDELGIYRLLINEELVDEIEDFYNSNLKVLVDYDTKRGTNLVETLEVYFRCNGNLRKMSEILYTHYNTILYRVERIENITGKKLDNEVERFNLHTSVKIYKLIEIKEKK